MQKINEKVKDIVDVHHFEHVRDFVLDPGRTLAGYRFTDITADLMSKWITAVGAIRRGAGAAYAVAGYRGVGKSHLLAALMGILTKPEMRPEIADGLVRSTAESLSRRYFNVYFVQRGTGLSLIDEIKSTVAANTGASIATLSDSLNDLLLKAIGGGETPTVFFVDTAPTRIERVSRDDGQLLSEMAEAARGLGVFLGVALDDDISGADGVNASIVKSFAIDYLDQEHLYKIVDSHIFTKNQAKLAVLREIYGFYRETMPSFRWSERRFSSLYPLHPATLEIAPLIRLFVHDFALLSFASDAGVRILGRPANSLIGLDEMFDNVENRLRNISLLRRGMETYDRLDREVISKLPVNSRLYAKLILKGLFLYSMDGRGANAADISAAMLISQEDERAAEMSVSDVLDRLFETANDEIRTNIADDGSNRYAIKVEDRDTANEAVEEAAKDVSVATLQRVLVNLVAEKFADVSFETEDDVSTNCSVEWRGSLRRGVVNWFAEKALVKATNMDWRIDVIWPSNLGGDPLHDSDDAIAWHVAPPTDSEIETLRRYHILHNDIVLRDQVSEGLATALHSNTIAAGKVLQRIFFDDSRLIAGEYERSIGDDTAGYFNLSQMLSISLEPAFDALYPEHPRFESVLDQKRAARIIERFFGEGADVSPEDRALFETFIVPLGIGELDGDKIIRVKDVGSVIGPFVDRVLNEIDTSVTKSIEIATALSILSSAPIGLSSEAARLILAHLVADHNCDFVTLAGNRINKRSLHLQIVWDDIYGIAQAADEKRSTTRLLEWAKIITGDPTLTTLDTPEGRKAVSVAVSHWLKQWNGREIFNKFDDLADDYQTTFIWRSASNVRKTFGSAAEILSSAVKEPEKLVEALSKVAILFSDNEEEFDRRTTEFNNIERYFANAERVLMVERTVAALKPIKNKDLEDARLELCMKLNRGGNLLLGNGVDSILREWSDFTEKYRAYYFELHDRSMRTETGEFLISGMLRSRSWIDFEALQLNPDLAPSVEAARRSVSTIQRFNCVRTISDAESLALACECGASLNDLEEAFDSYEELRMTVGENLAMGRRSTTAELDLLTKYRNRGLAIPMDE